MNLLLAQWIKVCLHILSCYGTLISFINIHLSIHFLMAKKSTFKKVLLITLILTGIIALATCIIIPFVLPGIMKNKLIAYVETNTDNHLEIESIAFTGFNSIVINSIELRPKLTKEAFNEKKGYQSDWIHFKSPHIHMQGIDWLTLLSDKKIQLERIQLEEPTIYVYRDKRLADAPYKYKPLPSSIIRSTDFSLTIPLFELKKGTIAYEEHPEDKDSSAVLTFERLYASAYHISTDSSYLKEHPVMTIDGKGSILGSIEAEIKYTSNVLDKNDAFNVDAKVQAFAATHLNQCLPPLAGVAIKSGNVKKALIHFSADDNVADGKMEMYYENLAMEVLSKSSGEESEIKSFLANILIKDEIKDPETFQEGDKTGVIHFERRKDRFIFNYWWNAIKSGVVSIVTPFESLAQKP